jgi:hypothetical protein
MATTASEKSEKSEETPAGSPFFAFFASEDAAAAPA